MTKWGWRLVLAMAMLWMQQAGLRHDLDHALKDQDLAAHVLCQECLSHHGAQAALPSSAVSLARLPLRHEQALAPLIASRDVPAYTAYWSRAPPSPSV